MADYVALEDAEAPPAPAPAAPPAVSVSPSAFISIPNDPSNIPLSPRPLHPHLLFSRVLAFNSRPLCNRAVFFLYPGFLLVLASFMLAIGVSERRQPSSGQLSLWLIVAAALTIVLSGLCLLTLFTILLPFRPASPHPPILIPALLCTTTVHTAVTLCWFVVGNVWFSLAGRDASSTVVRTVFWVLVWLYAQLMIQLLVSVVAWSVRKGCPCIRRSEEASRMEEERRRQDGPLQLPGPAGAGRPLGGGGGAQYI
jgi:hypothetical protein